MTSTKDFQASGKDAWPFKKTSKTAKHDIFSLISFLLNAFACLQGVRTLLRIRQPNSVLVNFDPDIYLSSLS
jgi:hypothetical protein